MVTSSQKERNMAGFFSQMKIILWKNTILYYRNLTGLISEVFLAGLFIWLIVIIISSTEGDIGKDTDFNDYSLIQSSVLEFFGNDFSMDTIYYYPPSILTDNLMQNVLKTNNNRQYTNNRIKNVESTNVSGIMNEGMNSNDSSLQALVSFPAYLANMTEWPDVILYTIYLKMSGSTGFSENFSNKFRMNSKDIYNNPIDSCKEVTNMDRLERQFNELKHVIDTNIINTIVKTDSPISKTLKSRMNHFVSTVEIELFPTANKWINQSIVYEVYEYLISTIDTKDPTVYFSAFDCPTYMIDPIKTMFSFMVPILISLSYLVTFIVNVSNIIIEKETKMKEYLRLIGVKSTVIWMCWVIRSLVFYFIVSSAIAFILIFVERENSTLTFFSYTSSYLIFAVLIVYSIQITFLSLLVGQFFRKTFAAKTTSLFVWTFTLINFYGALPAQVVFLLAIFPNYALNFIFQVIYQFENGKKTLGLSNIFDTYYYDVNGVDEGFSSNSVSVGGLLLSMIGWSIAFTILSWYIEKIFPGEYGVKLPLYFPFMPSYWFENTSRENVDEDNSLLNNSLDQDIPGNEFFEKAPDDLKSTVKISNLSKVFKQGFESKTVVNNLSIDFYENQITGFLGHNGAGKSTVTFILCGLYEPSAGTAYILGKDIRKNMQTIRASIGYCPQHSILFDELTVHQHLDLVASIKGFPKDQLKGEIRNLSTLVGLENDLNKLSKKLSGGMQRRLALAMALIGNSKVIILDEPTSGLDPFNRRMVWELLRKYKKGRTIILTTHYMEEADVLSDRIALMNHGQVKCCGSPVFLKEKFGSGYRITLTKSDGFDRVAFDDMVKSTVGEPPVILSNMAKELCFGVKQEFNSKLPQLLNNIEAKKKDIGVLNYGISTSTVEEVFLKAGSIDINEDQTEEHQLFNVFDSNDQKKSTLNLIRQQTIAILIKRFKIFKRRCVIAVLALLVPILLESSFNNVSAGLGNFIQEFFDPMKSKPKVFLANPNEYGYQNIPYKIISKNDDSEFENFLKSYISNKGSESKVSYDRVMNSSVNEFVKNKQQKNTMDFIRNYYMGYVFDNVKNNVIIYFK